MDGYIPISTQTAKSQLQLLSFSSTSSARHRHLLCIGSEALEKTQNLVLVFGSLNCDGYIKNFKIDSYIKKLHIGQKLTKIKKLM
jgi:hypothetical protein